MDDLTRMEETLLICIWRLKDEAYGYKIRKYVSELIQKDFTYGNLYSALNQLVKKGYVIKTPEKNAGQTHGKPRIFYAVSKEGIQALNASRKTYSLLWDGISDLGIDNF